MGCYGAIRGGPQPNPDDKAAKNKPSKRMRERRSELQVREVCVDCVWWRVEALWRAGQSRAEVVRMNGVTPFL